MKSIIVENLSKIYQIAPSCSSSSGFRDLLTQQLFSVFSRKKLKSEFYALKDISFEVEQGEVIGLIGKNGSGKSTLLKILSRITTPTSGKAILHGRIASLLEVGTGFHEELTGRENVYMSGIILGMKRWEISKYFDEIVSFAGIENFIDMPVKHYSSGMRLRLAFSVAAHLQSEILLVDEVLAVGDYEFEKKCMNMMESVATHGRTIIFVSHNLAAIRRLCKKTIYLSKGSVVTYDDTVSAIFQYAMALKNSSGIVQWDLDKMPGNSFVQIIEVKAIGADGVIKDIFCVDEEFAVDITYKVISCQEMFSVMLYFYNDQGVLLFSSVDTSNKNWHLTARKNGIYTSSCKLPMYLFKPGRIYIGLRVVTTSMKWKFFIDEVISFFVTDSIDNTDIVGDMGSEWPNVVIRPKFFWEIAQR